MKIYIKNMASQRCFIAVASVFSALNIQINSIEPGEVETASPLDYEAWQMLKEALEKEDFELILEKKQQVVERVKALIADLVQKNNDHTLKLSVYLSSKLPYDYHYLSSLFSKTEGITIEKYHISLKIERVKELLIFGELTVYEIARSLHYSSAAYLNIQFKKNTGGHAR